MGDSLLDETAAYISERSRKSKQLKKYDSPIKNKVGHTSSTLLNSCFFQRYRLSFRNLYSILLKQTLVHTEK